MEFECIVTLTNTSFQFCHVMMDMSLICFTMQITHYIHMKHIFKMILKLL